MGDLSARADMRAEPICPAEHQIDRLQNRCDRAERACKRHILPEQARAFGPATERFAQGAKMLRRGALEAVDRLLLIANREERATGLSRAFTGEEFLRQQFGDAPLRARVVLRLVNQQMADAPIKPVEHPCRAVLEQRDRAVDQIIIVEGAIGLLAGLVALDDRIREREQGRAGPRGLQRDARLVQVCEAVARGAQRLGCIGRGGNDGVAGEPLIGARLAVAFSQQRCAKCVNAGFTARSARGLGKLVSQFRVVLAALRERSADARDIITPENFGLRLHHRFQISVRRRAQRLSDHRLQGPVPRFSSAHHLAQRQPLAQHRTQQRLDIILARQPCDRLQRLPQRAIQRACRLFQRCSHRRAHPPARIRLRQHGKAGRDACLQRELPQDTLAKRVDGLDAQAARRVKHMREQPTRPRRLLGGRRAVQQLRQPPVEIARRSHRPFTQSAGQPARHLRRRSLGEGQTDDPFGRSPREQQAQDALDEHMGLAGACIRPHPSARGGIGGAGLQGFGAAQGFAHSPSPPRHSPTRARCAYGSKSHSALKAGRCIAV